MEKLQLPTSVHPNQAWIKFNTRQCVKEVLYGIAPMDSCHLILGWSWIRFKTLNLDERSLYLRHEGHKIKLKFMTPRQVNKDEHRLKELIENERIEKEAIESEERRENEEKEKEEREAKDRKFICQ